MNTAKKQLLNLLALTQTFLKQETFSNKKKIVSPESLAFFKKTHLIFFPPKEKPVIPPPKRETPVSDKPAKNLTNISKAASTSDELIVIKEEQTVRPIETGSTAAKLIRTPSPAEDQIKGQDPEMPIFFKLEPLAPLKKDSTSVLHEFPQLFKTLFPAISLYEKPPEFSVPLDQKNINTANEKEVISVLVLSHNDAPKQLTLLKNLTSAISLCLGPARLVHNSDILAETKNEDFFNSSGIRLIIATKQSLLFTSESTSCDPDEPDRDRFYLGKIPLIVLSDPSIYLKRPELKNRLWREICDKFLKSTGPGKK